MADSKTVDALDLNVGKRLAVLIQGVEDYVAAVEVREKARKDAIINLQVPTKEHVIDAPVKVPRGSKK